MIVKILVQFQGSSGGMVDAGDLKSPGSNAVLVQVQFRAPFLLCAPLAQQVEQVAFNHWVRGSNPLRRTISF